MAWLETARGLRLHYQDTGAGRPLVLLHGWAMSSRVFARVVPELAKAHRLLALDLPGHGESASSEPFTLSELVRDVEELFARLDLRDALLLGWSMGAQVALAAATALGDRLAGVALVSGTPRFTRGDDWAHGQPPAALDVLARQLDRGFERALARFFASMFTPGELVGRTPEQVRLDGGVARSSPGAVPGEVLEGSHGSRREGSAMDARSALPDPVAVRSGLELLAHVDLRSSLAAIAQPVLLVHGACDTICPPGASEYMAAHLPRARLELLPGVGHAPFLSRPERFVEILRDHAGALR